RGCGGRRRLGRFGLTRALPGPPFEQLLEPPQHHARVTIASNGAYALDRPPCARYVSSEMRARDLMQTEVVTIREDSHVDLLCDLFQVAHVHGVPVLNAMGELVGIVSEEDVIFGTMGLPDEEPPSRGL